MDKQKNVLKIAKQFPYNKIGSYKNVNPFTIAFVYPQSGEPCVVKGGLNDVKKYVEENYPIALVKYTLFHHGEHRGYYRVNGVDERNYNIRFKKSSPSYRGIEGSSLFPAQKAHRCKVIVTNRKYENRFEKELRRFPRCWMKELNPYVGVGA